MTAREINIHTLPSMLTALRLSRLRLPSFHKLWQDIAARADTEGWPAARFLAVLAEYELTERDMRRIHRHLTEAQRPEQAISRYHTNAITTVEVIQALINLAKEIGEARSRSEAEGLTPDELAFYDALADNDSAVQVMGNDQLKAVAHELLKKNFQSNM
ncbi:MAG: type I restriction enzyme endonuclease domain-containing protein [Cypionkella sp.]